MFGRFGKKAGVRKMTDERDGKTEERADGRPDEDSTVRLDKSEVDGVAGGAGKQSRDEPPELPEI